MSDKHINETPDRAERLEAEVRQLTQDKEILLSLAREILKTYGDCKSEKFKERLRPLAEKAVTAIQMTCQ